MKAAGTAARLARLGLLPGLLLVAGPSPAGALRTLRTAAHASDALAPLVAMLTLLAWCLTAWLAAVAVGVWAEARRGRAAGTASAVVARLAPASVRRVVALSLGLSVAAAVASASPAMAGNGTAGAAGGPTRSIASLDWPTATAAPGLDWNPPAPLPPPAPAAEAARPAAVVVRPGDSLWAIAAEHLPASATTRSIAQTWPAWWSANREAVGADPSLIHPGLQLTPPDQS